MQYSDLLLHLVVCFKSDSAVLSGSGQWRARHTHMELGACVRLDLLHCFVAEQNMLSLAKFWVLQGAFFYACFLSSRNAHLKHGSTGDTLHHGQPYYVTPGQELAIFAALLLSHGLLNSLPGTTMGWAASVFTTWMIGGGLVLVLCLVVVSEHKHSLWWVLTDFQELNLQDPSSSPVLAFMSGILMSSWCMMGYDAAAHMIEETISADEAARWAFIAPTGVSFVCGLLYLLALGVCISLQLPSIPSARLGVFSRMLKRLEAALLLCSCKAY
ncbi:hypothetical protein WJX84_000955 [Apatococcus fuscideae]|uniref:Uncharacterized protein n=1 Tax=Apatococcus fuscideae TaxID=2026836 RepID=A0AAW1T136_9CHLO